MNPFARLFAPASPAAQAVPPERMRATYRYWRIRQLYSTFAGYAVFYFVRKNLPVALPEMEKSLRLDKAKLGTFLTLQDIAYGISKFANGFLGDRLNARTFMATGLLLSAAANLLFGLSSGLWVLGILWVLNGWFQGIGFPPCARILSHWYGVQERGTMWGMWNTSHQVGAAGIALLAGALADRAGWRACFLVPAGIAGVAGLLLLERLRDTPTSLGLPPVETYTGQQAVPEPAMDPAAWRRLVRERVFRNKHVWLISVGNFFVYAVRIAVLNWLVSFLKEERGASATYGGVMLAVFEIAGMIGALVAGWLSDRHFGSRRTPLCVAYMLLLAGSVFAFWKAPAHGMLVDGGLIFMMGFMVYGPQFLVGVAAADLATKRAAASAIGLAGIFGYASGPITGAGMGAIVDRWGWSAGIATLLACALLGALPFALAWRAAAPTDETAPADEATR